MRSCLHTKMTMQCSTKLMEIKHKNKEALCAYLKETQGIEISPDTIFDIQVKRLHEYKRQQLNALYIIDKYLEIKAGKIPSAPVTAIFGAKAAPAYTIAKGYHPSDPVPAGDHQQ